MLFRTVSKGILLGNIFFYIFKTEWHQIICFVISLWTIPFPCLKGEAGNGLTLSPQKSWQCHTTSFSSSACGDTWWAAVISPAVCTLPCDCHVHFLCWGNLEAPVHLTHCHPVFHSAQRDIWVSLFFSPPFSLCLSLSLLGTVLVFHGTLLSKTWERN